MLVYLWFRFELIYGVAAVVACFHDTLITVGAFSLTNTEISLTVIAAILTLIGYSMNDTIVVFDRIRENLRLSRREKLSDLVNRSINQTLSRTVLTSGPDLPDRTVAVPLRRPGAASVLVRAGGGHSHRHLLVHCGCRSHAGGLSGLARRPGKGCRSPRGKESQGMMLPFACEPGNLASESDQPAILEPRRLHPPLGLWYRTGAGFSGGQSPRKFVLGCSALPRMGAPASTSGTFWGPLRCL